MRDPLDIRLCNCARCRCVLRGQDEHLADLSLEDRRLYPHQVHVRLDDRPFCQACVAAITADELDEDDE